MALDLVQRYKAPDLAVEVDSGARTILPGTNVTFTTDPVTGAITINGAPGGSGTVTSVGLAAPTGFTVSGSPVTTSGTLTFSYTAGYVGYTTAEQTKLAGIAPGATANTGTVTSVNHTGSTGLTIGGTNPITSSGTTTFTLSANLQAWSAVTVASKANLASPIFTGDPRAPTPATADNDTSIATTAFVKNQGYATTAALGSYVLKAGDTMTGTLNGTSVAMSGTVTSGQNFQSSTTNVVLAPTGAGGIFLRPNGAASSTGEVIIDNAGNVQTHGSLFSNGNLYVAGDLYSYRAGGTTGVLFLTSSATRYLFYNGTSYVMPGAALNLDSGVQLGTGGKLLSKISLGTAAPSGLADGELYLRY